MSPSSRPCLAATAVLIGVGFGVGFGVGTGVGLGVGFGVGRGVGFGGGVGLGGGATMGGLVAQGIGLPSGITAKTLDWIKVSRTPRTTDRFMIMASKPKLHMWGKLNPAPDCS